MRDGWYADHRDLLKWAALAHLVDREGLGTVIQVAMFRSSNRLVLETESGPIAMPDQVWKHFRDLRGIEALAKESGFALSIIDAPFSSKGRLSYFSEVANKIRNSVGRKAILLDPDTGFEPRQPNANHVTASDVRVTWDALAEQDWLLLYQHQWRSTSWKQEATARFSDACDSAKVEVFRAAASPSDVVLLAARKRGTGDA